MAHRLFLALRCPALRLLARLVHLMCLVSTCHLRHGSALRFLLLRFVDPHFPRSRHSGSRRLLRRQTPLVSSRAHLCPSPPRRSAVAFLPRRRPARMCWRLFTVSLPGPGIFLLLISPSTVALSHLVTSDKLWTLFLLPPPRRVLLGPMPFPCLVPFSLLLGPWVLSFPLPRPLRSCRPTEKHLSGVRFSTACPSLPPFPF